MYKLITGILFFSPLWAYAYYYAVTKARNAEERNSARDLVIAMVLGSILVGLVFGFIDWLL
jgi:Sec-independent protein secretion pathway component TatC